MRPLRSPWVAVLSASALACLQWGRPAAAPNVTAFELGEVYAYPNPAKAGQRPTIYVEAAGADSVEIRLYDLSGRLLQEASLAGPQEAFTHALDVSKLGSGVYIYVVSARKPGEPVRRATGKVALIK